MTDEELEAIRRATDDLDRVPASYAYTLLAEVDRLRAENERLQRSIHDRDNYAAWADGRG